MMASEKTSSPEEQPGTQMRMGAPTDLRSARSAGKIRWLSASEGKS